MARMSFGRALERIWPEYLQNIRVFKVKEVRL